MTTSADGMTGMQAFDRVLRTATELAASDAKAREVVAFLLKKIDKLEAELTAVALKRDVLRLERDRLRNRLEPLEYIETSHTALWDVANEAKTLLGNIAKLERHKTRRRMLTEQVVKLQAALNHIKWKGNYRPF